MQYTYCTGMYKVYFKIVIINVLYNEHAGNTELHALFKLV